MITPRSVKAERSLYASEESRTLRRISIRRLKLIILSLNAPTDPSLLPCAPGKTPKAIPSRTGNTQGSDDCPVRQTYSVSLKPLVNTRRFQTQKNPYPPIKCQWIQSELNQISLRKVRHRHPIPPLVPFPVTEAGIMFITTMPRRD